MKIFLDTANLQDIKKWYETGLVDGVTTNPTHLAKEGSGESEEGASENSGTKSGKKLTPTELIKQICDIVVDGQISVEVTETEPEKVYAQAIKIANIAENVVVKIPCHRDYYEIIRKLVHEKVPLNITLVFSPLQALFMCKLGVQYISPFIGRLDDAGENGLEIFEKIHDVVAGQGFFDTEIIDASATEIISSHATKIIAASVRDVKTFEAAMLAGADVVTVPIAVLQEATQHKLTDAGMKKFLDDWKKLGIKQFP